MKRILAAAVLLSTLALAGCTWATKPDSAGVQVAKIAVQLGTSKFIAKAPEAEQAARAKRIAEVVGDIEAIAKGGEGVTLPFLEAAIRKNLPVGLQPEDRIAVNALVELVLGELHARMDKGVLKPEQILAVTMIASWIVEATTYYTG